MKDNINFLLVHTCDIERADVDIDTSLIRDRRIAKWDVIAANARCWFDPTSTSYIFNDQLGQQPIKTFTVYFVGDTDVREGDRLKRTVNGATVYSLVRQVQDYSDQGMHVVCQVEEKRYAMQAPS